MIGKIQVKETSVGVPGLIVTAYDIDLESYEDQNLNFSKYSGSDFWNKFKHVDRLVCYYRPKWNVLTGL
jgi:hypothetical protein